MKRTLLSALTILVASAAVAPVASAVESANFDIQEARLEALDARTKNTVHKLRLEHLNNQSKAIEDIQAARLEALDARTKAVEDIQEARLEALDARTKTTVEHKIEVLYLNTQTKAVEDIQAARLEALDARTKAN